MKRFRCIILPFIIAGLIGTMAVRPQTQPELNAEACREFRIADDELNKTYNQILRIYKDNAEFIEKLKTAQRAWLVFRDAHLASIYPKAKPVEYGSIKPVCRCDILSKLTNERTKALNVWLTGVDEGETCAGSIKFKGELNRLKRDTSK